MGLDKAADIPSCAVLALVPIIRSSAERAVVFRVLPGFAGEFLDGGVERRQDGAVLGLVVQAFGYGLDVAREAGEDVKLRSRPMTSDISTPPPPPCAGGCCGCDDDGSFDGGMAGPTGSMMRGVCLSVSCAKSLGSARSWADVDATSIWSRYDDKNLILVAI